MSWFLTGLRHEAIRLSKKHGWLQKHELLILNKLIGSNTDNEQVEMLDAIAASTDVLAEVEDGLFLEETLALLTPLQQKVIRETIVDAATEKEVSVDLGISQPAVHQIKVRALKRIRAHAINGIFD